MIRRFLPWLPLFLLSSACVTMMPVADQAPPQPPGDGVIIVGQARLDPWAVTEHLPPTTICPQNNCRKINLGFTYAPDSPVDPDSLHHGLDVFAAVEPGKTFFIQAPRRPLYLRVVRLLRQLHLARVGGSGDPTAVDADYVTCTGSKAISVGPADRMIYVGTFVCHHGPQASRGIEVKDQSDSLANHLGELRLKRVPEIRLAQDLQ